MSLSKPYAEHMSCLRAETFVGQFWSSRTNISYTKELLLICIKGSRCQHNLPRTLAVFIQGWNKTLGHSSALHLY